MKKAAIKNNFLITLIKKFFFIKNDQTEYIDFREAETREYKDYLRYYQQATRWR